MSAVRHAVTFVAGLLFAVGLGVAQMTRPSKVLGFLDVTGAWDPSLACVMGAALGVTFLLFPRILRRDRPVLGGAFDVPAATRVDGRLLAGAALFGVGWGASGYCPGPAVVTAAAGAGSAVVFTLAMLAGMALFAWSHRAPADDA